MHEPDIYYSYDEDRCFLTVDYDAEQNRVCIRGGRHGLAMLAEFFAYYASYADEKVTSDDHDHWQLLTGGLKEFIINSRPHLKPPGKVEAKRWNNL